jgi:hypothetical protein
VNTNDEGPPRRDPHHAIAPPENVVLDEREAQVRTVAEVIAGSNGWSLPYTIRQVRRVCGDERDPFSAIEALQYGYGGAGKPLEAQYPQYNRAERRKAKALTAGGKKLWYVATRERCVKIKAESPAAAKDAFIRRFGGDSDSNIAIRRDTCEEPYAL